MSVLGSDATLIEPYKSRCSIPKIVQTLRVGRAAAQPGEGASREEHKKFVIYLVKADEGMQVA
jgi:hypothetical protein